MSSSEAAAAPGLVAPPDVRTVKTSMGTWCCSVQGARRRPGDPDVLLLHSMFVDASQWSGQVAPLARLGRVVALDMPGHGRSEVPPPFDLPAHADALARALAALGVERAICVGHSWGGALALHLAVRHPERVAGLAVMGSSAEAQRRGRRLQYRLLLAIVRRFGLTPWLARSRIAPLMFSPRTRRERPDLVAAFVRTATAIPVKALERAAVAVAIDPPPLLERLGALAVPALVVCGLDDRAYPRGVAERMARAISGARLEWIEGAGHLAALERPEEVNRVLLPFVAGILS